MNHIMLDLETMGNGSNAAIIAIGAVEFNLEQSSTGDTFYSVVDLESSVRAGGVMDADTVRWWLQQGEDARKEFFNAAPHIMVVLNLFAVWLGNRGKKDNICIWGNGSDFDNVILMNAYKYCDLKMPWFGKNNRCYRTIKSLYPNIKRKQLSTKHNALADAVSQANHLMVLLNYIFNGAIPNGGNNDNRQEVPDKSN